MGLRFRKSVKIAPGVKLNFNKKSTGVTFGGKGVHYTVNSSGKKTASVGIPGTGLSYSTSSGGKSSAHTTDTSGNNDFTPNPNEPKENTPFYKKKWFIIVAVVLLLSIIGSAVSGTSSDEPQTTADSSSEYTAEITTTEKETKQVAETTKLNSVQKTQPQTTPAIAHTNKPTAPATKTEKTFVLNTKTKVYHLSSCRHAKKIKAENKEILKTIPSGYTPCKVCNP